jgi:tetrahydromethanopterin S-methyltransferase subunit C
MLGTVATTIFNRFSDKLSIGKSSIIKFGIRALGYIVAFILNTRITFIIAIVIAFITSRILEDKVTVSFLQIIDENNQFLYGNIRYFIVSLGEGIGAFLAGLLLTKSFGFLFLGAAIITIIQTIIMLYLDKLKRKFN